VAAVNGHSTVDVTYDRFTLETGYSPINARVPAANDRMGSRRPGTSATLCYLSSGLAALPLGTEPGTKNLSV